MLNFGFDNSVGTSGGSGTVKDVEKNIAMLKLILINCCKKFPEYCGLTVTANYDFGPGEYDAGNKPAPRNGYDASDLTQYHANLDKIATKEDGIRVLITNKSIRRGKTKAGGWTEGGGILLDPGPPEMQGSGSGGLAHEVGHYCGYDSTECGPYISDTGVDKTHSKEPGNPMFWKNTPGTDPDKCYCKALFSKAK